MTDAIEQIETICGRVVRRDIRRLVESARGGLAGFTRSLVDRHPANVAIVTGFYVPQGRPPAAETDGLSGSTMLAAGLIEAGHKAVVVTDWPCFPALKAAAAGAPVPVEAIGCGIDDDSVLSLWEQLKADGLTHLIAIERVGVAADGNSYDMMGKPMGEFTARFDLWFDRAPEDRIVTLGVGDGGNEIGMGNVPRALVVEDIPNGEAIACATRADHLFVCGVSNWAGAAILATASRFDPGRADSYLRHASPAIERRLLEHAVYLGPAIDDIGDPSTRPGRPVLWIDDIPLAKHLEVLREITDAVSHQ